MSAPRARLAAFALVAVSATLEPASIRIGDPARLTLTVEHAAGEAVPLPELGRGRAVVVTDRTSATAPLEAGRARTTVAVTLTSFEVGEHRVGEGEAAATLRVRSVLSGGDEALRPPKAPAAWPARRRGRAGWAGALALLAAAAAAVGLRRLRPRLRPAAPVPPVPTPREVALRALAGLRAAGPPAPERVEPHYRELSAVVRGYLEGRFGLRAPERTTEEFIREAAGSGLLTPAHQELVRAFLEQCDLVKFARHLPARDDAAAALAAAERLVRET